MRLDDPLFNVIEDLQRRLQLINSAIIEYREANGLDRDTKRASIQTLGGEFAARITSLGFMIDDHKLQPSTVPPRNIEAILRDLRKTYGRFQQIRLHIGALIETGLIRKILAVRNSAAHADLEGHPREIEEETIIDMLENLQTLVHKLSLVGDIILEAGIVWKN